METASNQATAIVVQQEKKKEEIKPSITWSGIGKYESVAEWRTTLKPTTDYRAGLLAFCRHYKLSPDRLAKMKSKTAKKKIIAFLNYMKAHAQPYGGKRRAGQFSSNSIKPYMTHVQSFTEYWEIPLPWSKIQKMYPEEVDNDLRAYRREEIAKLLTFADPREKHMILAPAASGMREAAESIDELKHEFIVTLHEPGTNEYNAIKHRLYNGALEGERIMITSAGVLIHIRSLLAFLLSSPDAVPEFPANTIGMMIVYGNSKKAKYVSFKTPEAVVHTMEELHYRRSHHEILRPSTPVVRDFFRPLGRNVNHARHITPSRVNQVVRALCQRAALPMDELQPLHGLRKFFDTMCKNAGIDHMFKEVFMGHSVKLDDVYYDIENPESVYKMVTEYMKAVDLLTIDPKFRLQRQVAQQKQALAKKDELISRYEVISIEFKHVLDKTAEQAKKIEDLERQVNNGGGAPVPPAPAV